VAKAGAAGDAGRSRWTSLSDSQLLAQCQVDTYRASGPGGQKRNKTSSAVRLRHSPSGLRVIAEESRSQHQNRARAIRRLRQALELQIREDLPTEFLKPEVLGRLPAYQDARRGDGRLVIGPKDARFWPAAGVVLDVWAALKGRVSLAAAALGISSGNLIDFLKTDPKLWQQANQIRIRFGHKPLTA
jgi:hypothetical protein